MNKSDLRQGMIVETKLGELLMVCEFENGLQLVNKNSVSNLDLYNDNLTNTAYESADIVKIRKPANRHHLMMDNWSEAQVIWERDKITLTKEEKALIKLLGKNWKWIAKDENGSFFAYDERPQKRENYWSAGGALKCLSNINENIKFFFLSWDDEEPTSLDELRELIGVDNNEENDSKY